MNDVVKEDVMRHPLFHKRTSKFKVSQKHFNTDKPPAAVRLPAGTSQPQIQALPNTRTRPAPIPAVPSQVQNVHTKAPQLPGQSERSLPI